MTFGTIADGGGSPESLPIQTDDTDRHVLGNDRTSLADENLTG